MTDEEWEKETRLRFDCSLKAKLFKAREIVIIEDFIHTERNHAADEKMHSK